MPRPVYLDHNATTPLDSAVLAAMLPWLESNFGNASSRHEYGRQVRQAIDEARQKVAAAVNAHPTEVVFTSGGSEANNLFLKGAAAGFKPGIIAISAIEHPCVLKPAAQLVANGWQLRYIAVDGACRGNFADFREAVQAKPKLVSIMLANNETGVIQDMKAIGDICKKHGILFMSDATQAVGKIDVNPKEMGVHLMAFTGHKMYGPKGVGALYVCRKNPRVKVTAQQDGGGHERGMRSGTLNVPAIVGFGKAAKIAKEEMVAEAARLSAMRDDLQKRLMANLEEVYINGNVDSRMPHVTNLSFKHVEGEGLMMTFNQEIAVSSGSACTSASLEPSYVLVALGLGDDLAHSSIRFSLGRFTTNEEIDYAVEALTKGVSHMRDLSPIWEMYQEGIDLNSVVWSEH